MTPKGSFENQFDDYSLDIAANIINDAKDGISEKFQTKLQNFKTMKLQLLKTKMESDIFYDSTVYTGSAGLALYYFMCSLKNDASSQESLKMALEYLDIENLKGRRISFLCGDAGPLAIATVISYKLGTKRNDKILPDYKTLAHRLMSLISLLNESPDEILYGKAGYLYALLFVNKHINGKEIIPVNHIEKVINSILKSGKQYSAQMKSDSPLLWHWHDKVYFGAAHGMAGILYMLLQARLHINIIEIRSFIKPAIDWLLSQRYHSGNFPSSMGSTSGDKLIQWCHGAPGYVPLCLLAAQIFEEEKYMKVALQCGDLIWQRGLCTKGYSICHGVSGNAYAFIQLFQATKRPLYLYRACCFMEWCAVERPGTELHRPDRPASLFEGLSGRLYLAEDITRIAEARFPAFGL
ncbi:lanC-like protein 2 isoform X1 [Trichoplusia ni]|uniref:LanC-like protein 2 isoform X1 n=1 Tax=Trichoplusia ni TaxID=7111 RepID=A0A7E5X2U7_TRINI|nr:lanC-like protein 2 isoform X1 [Trichoplusia ni]